MSSSSHRKYLETNGKVLKSDVNQREEKVNAIQLAMIKWSEKVTNEQVLTVLERRGQF